MRCICTALLIGVILLGAAGQARGQTNEEAFEQFQWRVAAPGVAAQAMGGAVVARAGDATAGVTNPAGLGRIDRPRLSVEFGRTELRAGRFSTVDALSTGALTSSLETASALSFVGGALPIGQSGVVIGLARHQTLSYESAFALPPRAVPGVTGALRAQIPVDSQVDFEVVSYVASIGWAAHESLSLGVSASVDRLRADSLSTRYNVRLGSGTFDLTRTSIVANASRVTGTDTGVGFIAGGLYQPIDAIAVGVAYARRPSLTVSGDFQLNPGRLRNANEPLVSQVGFPKPVTLKVPDHVVAGLAVRVHPRLLLAVDGIYVRYSELAEDLLPVIGFDLVTPADYEIDDGGAVHAGGQVNIGPSEYPVFLRAGFFTTPDHRLRFAGTVQPGTAITAIQAQRTNALERSRFGTGSHETDVRGTFGGGVAIGRHAQVDVAYVWRRALLVSVGGRW